MDGRGEDSWKGVRQSEEEEVRGMGWKDAVDDALKEKAWRRNKDLQKSMKWLHGEDYNRRRRKR